MSSARIAANRRNAKRSTGPRSRSGKARVAKNALRHGLAVPVTSLPELNAKIATLTRAIAGADADDARLDVARRIAEAHLDIMRIRAIRLGLMGQVLDSDRVPARFARNRLRCITKSLRGLRGLVPSEYLVLVGLSGSEVLRPMASSTRLNTITSETPDLALVSPALARLQQVGEGERLAAALDEAAGQIAALERYERRALSRRKSAVRALDVPT